MEYDGASGMCIGIASELLGLNRLVRSDGRSIGLNASDCVEKCEGQFMALGSPIHNCDCVACGVTVQADRGKRGSDVEGDVHQFV